LSDIPKLRTGEAAFRPPRLIVNAVEGWGKTTLGAYAPRPALLMAPQETGYETLLGVGLVPVIDRAAIPDWPGLLNMADWLKDGQHETIVLDAMSGMERLCHEHVCQRDFGGDWGEHGFSSYQKGYDVAVADWLHLVARLDILNQKGKAIVILSHCRIKTFKNPLGPDYDRYSFDVHDKTWSVTAKWADAILFGTFKTVLEKDKSGKMKPKGGDTRILRTTRSDAFDAKNRYGMKAELEMPNDHTQMWSTLWANLAARKDVADAAAQ